MDGNKYYRFYFCAFYYFSVVIGINIIVAFAIDMYSSVERLDAEREKTLEMLKKEMNDSMFEKQALQKQKTLAADEKAIDEFFKDYIPLEKKSTFKK